MKNIKKIITKIRETKSWFFENMQLINLQSDSSREEKRRLRSTKLEMKNEK